ncbi:lamin tail domain-containing protein, partial [Candidatus Acetothermia bacterium]|nr:lamin tail domain-containing protein [Candidatus Acetothermia bacterium]
MRRYSGQQGFLGLLLLGLALSVAANAAMVSSVNSGDVVISEVAWMGTAANSAHEWIELYNNTNQAVSLNGWRVVSLTDSSPNFTISSTNCSNLSIPAKGFFLLERTSNSTVNDIAADCIYTGALSDSGEALALRDAANNIIDTANGNGGAWPAGTTSPRATMERIDLAAADSDANWDTNDGVHRNGLDANNNPINGTPKALRQRASFSALDVVISEIAWMGTEADANDEWIELYNATNQAISLVSWQLVAADGIPTITFSSSICSNLVIPAQGFLLLERTDDTTISDVTADCVYSGALSNSGEALTLKDPSNNIIDTANANGGLWPAGSEVLKATMERLDLLAPDSDANWATNNQIQRNGRDANSNFINGTPKAHKPPYVTITSPTALAPAYRKQGDSLSVSFTTDEAGVYSIRVDGAVCNTGAISAGAHTLVCALPISFSEGAKDVLVEVVDNTTVTGTTTQIGAVQIDNTPPAVKLITPNGGEIISGESSFNILWYCTDLHFGAAPIALYYSTDAGGTFPYVIAGSTENDGAFSWKVPNIDTSSARVRVLCTDRVGNFTQRDSEGNFTITTGFALRALKTASSASCEEGYRLITYLITIINISSVIAQPDNPGNEFEDMLPAGTLHMSAEATSGIVGFDGTMLTWNGSLAPNTSVSIFWRVMHNVATGTSISNQGTVFFDADFNGSNESSALTDNPFTPASNDPTIITAVTPGDVNGDNKINTIDARMVQQHADGVSTLTDAAWTAANVNCDRDVDLADATAIAKKGIGLPTGIPGFTQLPPSPQPSPWKGEGLLLVLLPMLFLLLLRRSRKIATLLLALGLLSTLTGCVGFLGIAPPSGPAVYLTSVAMPDGATRFIELRVQELTAQGGLASLQGRITFPSGVAIQSLTGLSGFVVKAICGVVSEPCSSPNELRFSIVKSSAGGVSNGAILRIAVQASGGSGQVYTLSWSGSAQAPIVLGGNTNVEITGFSTG